MYLLSIKLYVYCCTFSETSAAVSNSDDITVTTIFKQPMLYSHLAYFAAVQLRFLFFMGNINTLLNRKMDGNTLEGKH